MVAEYQVLNFGFDQNRFQKLFVVTQHSLSFFLLSCLRSGQCYKHLRGRKSRFS